MIIHRVDIMIRTKGAATAGDGMEAAKAVEAFYTDTFTVDGNSINIYLRGDPGEDYDIPAILLTIEEAMKDRTTSVCAVDVTSQFGGYSYYHTPNSTIEEVIEFYRELIDNVRTNLSEFENEIDELSPP